jgi:hypothetical protein
MTSRNAPHGWIIDGDGWFVRAMRPGDQLIGYVPRFGFTCEGAIFVREAQHCHDYDLGVVTSLVREGAR